MPVNNAEHLHNHHNHHQGYYNKEFSNARPNSPKYSSPFSSRESSPPYPSSPTSVSPLSTSPPLRRAFSRNFSLIPEDRAVDQPLILPQKFPRRSSKEARFVRLLLWWPLFLVGFLQIVFQYLRCNLSQLLLLFSPRFWLSNLWCMLHRLLRLPLLALHEAVNRLHSDSAERNRRKRTVLISSGSSIQTLHLARNFYSSGTRVVVFDFEGPFPPLAKFSAAVSKCYTVPNPATGSVNDYITAICEIVLAENVTFYVPTCVSTASYFDALVKPHLELLGCQSFIAGIHELAVLDDILETLELCKTHRIPVPSYKCVESREELLGLYDTGWLSGFRNVIMSVGHLGRVERRKFELPPSKSEALKFNCEVSDKRPWIVVHDLPGEHYVTCTTVKDNRVLANVTCLVQSDTKNLIPENNEEVEKWLKEFFNSVRFQRPINGHFTFRLVKGPDHILPVGIRAGVSLPYLCHTSVHTKLLWKSCPHFSRENSGALIQSRYWIHDMFLRTLRHPSVESLTNLIGTVLDKREALFLFWDPLPYCAYYHYQLPLLSIREFLQKIRNRNQDRAGMRQIQ